MTWQMLVMFVFSLSIVATLEDERAFLVLGAHRRRRDDGGRDCESDGSRKLPNHELLPIKQRLCLVVLGLE